MLLGGMLIACLVIRAIVREREIGVPELPTGWRVRSGRVHFRGAECWGSVQTWTFFLEFCCCNVARVVPLYPVKSKVTKINSIFVVSVPPSTKPPNNAILQMQSPVPRYAVTHHQLRQAASGRKPARQSARGDR
ncbi:hypothetical protein F4780DRAFT_765510 [Xylariomycetidae sp. FL0641]|nr:hypothetical protein F4780DRAFT_765510 [Xylariomycetidae sp. FL0641]